MCVIRVEVGVDVRDVDVGEEGGEVKAGVGLEVVVEEVLAEVWKQSPKWQLIIVERHHIIVVIVQL